jgi:hypothetical protein
VLQLAFENVGDDFHVAMRMRGKSSVGRDPIFVDDAQRAESHPLRIPIIAKAEGVMSFEPAVVSATTFLAGTNLNHGVSPFQVEFLGSNELINIRCYEDAESSERRQRGKSQQNSSKSEREGA